MCRNVRVIITVQDECGEYNKHSIVVESSDLAPIKRMVFGLDSVVMRETRGNAITIMAGSIRVSAIHIKSTCFRSLVEPCFLSSLEDGKILTFPGEGNYKNNNGQ